ncbi:DoxX family protein [Oceanobacter mangrovi]|uniref:DoxX family protein n=1 Tax=Oceanobacter mangrovi TaxID=2862510 RepID=UPI001C8EB735|nr:DoxX family protein [Oceanobacter mangrovi]
MNLISRSDFAIKASNFNIFNGLVLMRIACGLFMLPHPFGKFADGAPAAGTVAFFSKVGFQPAELWVWIAGASELAFSLLLIAGICTRWAALGLASVMAVAVYSIYALKGFVWMSTAGGFEYAAFFGTMLIALAITEFKRHPLF